MDSGPLSGRTASRYYAFVEDADVFEDLADVPSYGMPAVVEVLAARRRLNLAHPTHVVWLDCIEQDFFDGLTWTSEAIVGNDEQQRAERRRDLEALPDGRMRAAFLLLNWDEERSLFEDFRDAAWHVVEFGPPKAAPLCLGADFELAMSGPFLLLGLSSLTRASGDQLDRLTTAFNLDFIPDADLGDDDEGSGIPITPDPPPDDSVDYLPTLPKPAGLDLPAPLYMSEG